MKANKNILLALFILALGVLACDLAILEPTTGNAAELFPTKPVLPSPTMTGTGTPAPIACTVNAAEALHLRDAPNIEGHVITWLLPGEVLTLSPDPPAGVWVKVTTAGKLTGWINSNYCERN